MRDKLEPGAMIVGAIVLAAGVLVLLGCAAYDWGRILVDIFGPGYALLVVGGLVTVCLVADFVAPRSDNRSWFWALIDGALSSGADGD